MSVRPTVCTTFANGLGRGRSRSARARPAAQQRKKIDDERRVRFDMAANVTGPRAGAQHPCGRPAKTPGGADARAPGRASCRAGLWAPAELRRGLRMGWVRPGPLFGFLLTFPHYLLQ